MPYKIYTIAVANWDETVQVRGLKVKIPGYEEFEFFTHRSFSEHNVPDNLRDWVVSEVSTGWEVGRGIYQRLAIADARKKLATVTPAKFREMIEDAKAKTGEVKS